MTDRPVTTSSKLRHLPLCATCIGFGQPCGTTDTSCFGDRTCTTGALPLIPPFLVSDGANSIYPVSYDGRTSLPASASLKITTHTHTSPCDVLNQWSPRSHSRSRPWPLLLVSMLCFALSGRCSAWWSPVRVSCVGRGAAERVGSGEKAGFPRVARAASCRALSSCASCSSLRIQLLRLGWRGGRLVCYLTSFVFIATDGFVSCGWHSKLLMK